MVHVSRVVKRKVWVRELVDLTDEDLAVFRFSLEQAIDRSTIAYKQIGSTVPTPPTEVVTDFLNNEQRRVARELLIDVVKLEKKLGRRP